MIIPLEKLPEHPPTKFQLVDNLTQITSEQYLTDYSPQDKPWDTNRAYAELVAAIYDQASESEFKRYGERITNCSGRLIFASCPDPTTGEVKKKLVHAFFCRVPTCPICQWRRSLLWKARMYQALPELTEKYPDARWLFLTLTVRNVAVEKLGETLSLMNDALKKMFKRKEFKPLLGYLRATEITRSAIGEAHPHFHILLLVDPSWFVENYVTQEDLIKVWQSCLKVDYLPSVRINTVKEKNKKCFENNKISSKELKKAILETLKYAVKPADMVVDKSWFLKMTKGRFRRRLVASGGVLRHILREEEESNESLVSLESTSETLIQQYDAANQAVFNWYKKDLRYKRFINSFVYTNELKSDEEKVIVSSPDVKQVINEDLVVSNDNVISFDTVDEKPSMIVTPVDRPEIPYRSGWLKVKDYLRRKEENSLICNYTDCFLPDSFIQEIDKQDKFYLSNSFLTIKPLTTVIKLLKGYQQAPSLGIKIKFVKVISNYYQKYFKEINLTSVQNLLKYFYKHLLFSLPSKKLASSVIKGFVFSHSLEEVIEISSFLNRVSEVISSKERLTLRLELLGINPHLENFIFPLVVDT